MEGDIRKRWGCRLRENWRASLTYNDSSCQKGQNTERAQSIFYLLRLSTVHARIAFKRPPQCRSAPLLSLSVSRKPIFQEEVLITVQTEEPPGWRKETLSRVKREPTVEPVFMFRGHAWHSYEPRNPQETPFFIFRGHIWQYYAHEERYRVLINNNRFKSHNVCTILKYFLTEACFWSMNSWLALHSIRVYLPYQSD